MLCDFCNAESKGKYSSEHPIENFACGTRRMNTGKGIRIERSTRCYEAEIKRLKDESRYTCDFKLKEFPK